MNQNTPVIILCGHIRPPHCWLNKQQLFWDSFQNMKWDIDPIWERGRTIMLKPERWPLGLSNIPFRELST
jgi:hypothetical protein